MKMLVVVYIFFFVPFVAVSQDDISFPQVSIMSPNAASMAQYQDRPITLYTGTPDISIPLYEIDVDGFKLPITMNYHASGIKVSQEASWVGLGWSLNVGGNISRQIKEIDDFIDGGTDGRHYMNKGFYNTPDIVYDSPTMYGNYLPNAYKLGAHPKRWDTEPDMFFYSLPGNSGKFFLNHRKPILYNKSQNIEVRIKDNPRGGNYNTSKYFELIDGLGNKYIFKDVETTKSYRKTGYLNQNGNKAGAPLDNSVSSMSGGTGTVDQTSSWYLTEIVTNKNRHVYFYYEQEEQLLPTQESYEIKTGPSWLEGKIGETHDSYYMSKNTVKALTLSRIEYDFGTVYFRCSNRDDIKTLGHKSRKLDKISIYNKQSSLIKEVNFEYDYFNANHLEDDFNYLYLRLKLKRITDDSVERPYQFSYDNENSEMPVKNSKNTDYWGYYNGKTYGKNYCPEGEYLGVKLEGVNKSSDAKYIGWYTINEIIHPTGGSEKFEFEAHSHEGGSAFGGIRIKKIQTDRKTRLFQYEGPKLLSDPILGYWSNEKVNPYIDIWGCFVQTSESVAPMGSMHNGYTVGYDCVTESVDDDGNLTKIKSSYMNEGDEVMDDRIPEGPRFISFGDGLLVNKVIYDGDKLVSNTTYDYNYDRSEDVTVIYDRDKKYDESYVAYTMRVDWPQISKETTITFDINDNKKKQKTIKTFKYNKLGIPSEINTFDGLNNYKDLIFFPTDVVSSARVYKDMTDNNMVLNPVEILHLLNDSVIGGSRAPYKQENGLFLIQRNEKMNVTNMRAYNDSFLRAPNGYSPVEEFNNYDIYGNITQYKKNGVITTYLWGYNYHYPILEVQGITYTDVIKKLGGENVVNSFLSKDFYNDSEIYSFFSSLHSEIGVQAKIYTYSPLIGMTSMMDINGQKNYYKYNANHKLSAIEDHNHKIVQRFTYNYKK